MITDKCGGVYSFFFKSWWTSARCVRWVSTRCPLGVCWVSALSTGCPLGVRRSQRTQRIHWTRPTKQWTWRQTYVLALTIDTFCQIVHRVCPMSVIVSAGLSTVSFMNRQTPPDMSPGCWKSYFPWKFIMSIVLYWFNCQCKSCSWFSEQSSRLN